mmetsp:Transcript_22192/g.57001  ORF Transcript_22192/g.57001 Transcript_22192/m.57001 type:complete len:557 (-) Transcript_22192:208-1878(-)
MSPAWSWGAVQCGCATDACHARRVSARTGCTCLTTPPLWRWPDLALAPQTRSVRCSGLHLARGTCPVTAALTRRLAMTTAAALAPTWRPPARGPRRDHGALGWRASARTYIFFTYLISDISRTENSLAREDVEVRDGRDWLRRELGCDRSLLVHSELLLHEVEGRISELAASAAGSIELLEIVDCGGDVVRRRHTAGHRVVEHAGHCHVLVRVPSGRRHAESFPCVVLGATRDAGGVGDASLPTLARLWRRRRRGACTAGRHHLGLLDLAAEEVVAQLALVVVLGVALLHPTFGREAPAGRVVRRALLRHVRIDDGGSTRQELAMARRVLLQWYLHRHEDVEARAHGARADHCGGRLAPAQCVGAFSARLRLRAADLVIRALGLQPVAVDDAVGADGVVKQALRPGAVLLNGHALRRAQQHEVARVGVGCGVVVVRLGGELERTARVATGDGKECGLKADGDGRVECRVREIRRAVQTCVGTALADRRQVIAQRDWRKATVGGGGDERDPGRIDSAELLVPVVGAHREERHTVLALEVRVRDVCAPARQCATNCAA